MRITDPGVDTEIAELAQLDDDDGADGLSTAIVAFFEPMQASPSTRPPDLAARVRDRVRRRGDLPPPSLKT